MNSPKFWQSPPSFLAYALLPLGGLYGVALRARAVLQKPVRMDVPVICVGNFTLGGAGKTPTVLALATILKRRGETPFILSRGHGGSGGPPRRVDEKCHSAQDVGDEPLLMARRFPVVVGADRVAAARLAVEQGASVLVMDDGLLHHRLHKDVTIAVVDAQAGLGNGFVCPAGPLRAPLRWQTGLVDAVLLMTSARGDDAPKLASQLAPFHGARLRARLAPDPAAHVLRGLRVLGFCGIGLPDKFRATLQAIGAAVVHFESFPDHHMYTQEDARALVARARANNLTLVTTEKDHVRLLSGAASRAQLAGLANVVRVSVEAEPPDALERLILRCCALRHDA